MKVTIKAALILLIIFTGCKDQPVNVDDVQVEKEILTGGLDVDLILNSMYRPLNTIIPQTDSFALDVFEVLSTDKRAIHNSTTEALAIQLGMIMVDLSILESQSQGEDIGNHYAMLDSIAERLTINPESLKRSSLKLEKFYGEQSKESEEIDNVYLQTDKFFMDSSNESLAALSIFGRWIEAMYLAGKSQCESISSEVLIKNILQQKLTLNSLISILGDYQESLQVSEYVLMLKRLRRAYDEVEIRYAQNVSVEQAEAEPLNSQSAQIQYYPDTLDEVVSLICQIRESVIGTKA